jgi:hypothetical protein
MPAMCPAHRFHVHFTVPKVIGVVPVHVMKTIEGMDVHFYLFLTSARYCVSCKLRVLGRFAAEEEASHAH